MPTAVEILNQAADTFEAKPHLWLQRHLFYRTLPGTVHRACSIGIIDCGRELLYRENMPVWDARAKEEAINALADHLGLPPIASHTGESKTNSKRRAVARWKDNPRRTVEEVITALRGTAGVDRRDGS